MPHPTGSDRSRLPARHRLGTPGLVHCRAYPEIDFILTQKHRSWLSVLLVTTRRSGATLRRQVVQFFSLGWADAG
ncbi:MAG TPA: hypothetical protein VFQ77_22145 [Pseudonocardiaceae bacterium]|jgi:hypothetical protein|nr:hypothetical protein [Pseudonocardiaceae bacterium]